tara:strand:- start:528 stop:2249 length:1722 start_codon:yes stop_codon:yes gene_type:complete
MEKIFSIPLNTKLPEDFVEASFIPYLNQYKDYIYDIYFTCRMPPFEQDAMGDVIDGDIRETTLNALYISEKTGIPLSATFNNIQVTPNQSNLDIFIENFRPLYDAGIRIATIPHTTWLLTGQIQKEFPELYIKNTILREVTRANEIVNLAKAGFNYVNLDRDLMRDRDQLDRIMKAKAYCAEIGKPVKISLLANEWCWGGCPIMPEHYHYNMVRGKQQPQYFNDAISRVSCSNWDEKDPANALKQATIPPWRNDWKEFVDLGIDVFKMHGRENAMRLMESMDIIKRWVDGEELLYPQFDEYIEDTTLEEKPIDIWRNKIKTCKFDCWDCNYCDSVIHSRMKKNERTMDKDIELVLNSIDKAVRRESKFVEEGYDIPGLSSNIVRHFLNNLCSKEDAVYLELGVHAGSTFVAATMGHEITSFAVDDYSEQNISPFREDDIQSEGRVSLGHKGYQMSNPKNTILRSLRPNQHFYAKSIQDLKFPMFHGKKANVIFYDADHEPQATYDNLTYLYTVMDDQFIIVIDDANFMGVVEAVNIWVKENEIKVMFDRKILTAIPEDPNSWWNGIHVMVCKK